jgi:DNA polymerase III epsilon subunit-like protein
MPKIISWDIESGGLEANFSNIISIGWKELGKRKVHTRRIDQYPSFKKPLGFINDKALVKDVAKELSEADLWVIHYAKFDIPMLNSRLLFHDLPPLPYVPTIDTWRIARYQLKLSNNRLDTIVRFFDLHKKTPIDSQHWIRARAGCKASIDYIVKHNKADVVALEETYLKLRPLMKNHPNMNLVEEEKMGTKPKCPKCMSTKMQKRGWNCTPTSKRRRYFCTDCNAWSAGRPVSYGKQVEVR